LKEGLVMNKFYCKECGKETPKGRKKYCSNRCQYYYRNNIQTKDEIFGKKQIDKFRMELDLFINDLENKKWRVDFIDALRIVDFFTIFYGVRYTKLDMEGELIYMVEKLKKINDYEHSEL